MAKMTKVIGSILVVLGTIYSIVSVFLYLNSSASLDYNTGKLQTMSQAGVIYYAIASAIILIFGIILATDRILDKDKH